MKSIRSATALDAHGPLTVRVLTDPSSVGLIRVIDRPKTRTLWDT
jgi:hypothetical protein